MTTPAGLRALGLTTSESSRRGETIECQAGPTVFYDLEPCLSYEQGSCKGSVPPRARARCDSIRTCATRTRPGVTAYCPNGRGIIGGAVTRILAVDGPYG